MVVGAVGQGVPNRKQRLSLVDDSTDKPGHSFDVWIPNGGHHALGHPISAVLVDQRSGVLSTEVPARLPQQSGMDARVADVRQGHSDSTAQRYDGTSLFGYDEPETDMSCDGSEQVEFAEEAGQPRVDLFVLYRYQSVVGFVHATCDIRDHLRFFDGGAGQKVVAFDVLYHHPRSLLADVVR